MQVIIFIALFIVILTVLIYKINNKFEKKEFIIFLSITIIISIIIIIYENFNDNYFSRLFKDKYAKENGIEIYNLESKILNNKVLNSDKEVVLEFTYFKDIDNKNYVCKMNNIEINKINKYYVFTNFANIKEECIENK